jgi:hypothetical protein
MPSSFVTRNLIGAQNKRAWGMKNKKGRPEAGPPSGRLSNGQPSEG